MLIISNLSYLVNVSVIHTLFNNMDLGDLSYVSFSTVDEDLEFQACRTPHLVRDQLCQQLLTTQAKLLASQQAQKSLAEQLRSTEVARTRLGLSSSNIANHPVVLRLSVLTTTHHLIRRYQLILLRDMMRMKHSLRMNVRPQLWETWYRNENQLRREAPNVHNLFLWSLELQDNDGDANILPLTRFTPWRPAQ